MAPRLRIGIDLGGTKTEGIVMDAAGEVLIRERRPTPRDEGYEAILDGVAGLVGELERAAGGSCLVGIGTPGAVSAATGLMKNANTTCLNGRPLPEDLEQRLDRPIRVENDANCFALSEAVDGAARGYALVFGVILGTGVGGGVVHHGRLHRGPQHIAGEWGHNVMEMSGPPCYCGRSGCVETLISGPGLARDYRQLGGRPGVDAAGVVALAREEDPAAEVALDRFLDRFGRALAGVINILDPDAVVLGGGLSNMDELYTEGRERVAHHTFNDELSTPILRPLHGDSAGARGAACLWSPEERD